MFASKTTTRVLSDLGEFGLIDLIVKRCGPMISGVQGIGDDTAVVRPSGNRKILLTTDMLIEGTHFTRAMSAKWIGHKALACSLSDIAAMGGVPKYALVSLGVPPPLETHFVSDLYVGMTALAHQYGARIVGGDTVKNAKIIINVALTGEVNKSELITRDGAKPGDQIFVTGVLGRSFTTGYHLKFVPRLKESHYLVKKFKPTAMIDISDGLASDLGHILKKSCVGAIIEEKQIPRRSKATLNQALSDGEDFELLFTLTPKKAQRLMNQKHKPFRFYCIGEITDVAQKLQLRDRSGCLTELKIKGYSHF